MRLYLIRHGQTVGDIEDRYGGDYDDALSPEGKRQAKQLTSELTDSGIQIIYSSPLLRAKQTAQTLAMGLKCPIIVIPGLKERNQYGLLTGLTKMEARQKYPDLVEKVKDRMNLLPQAEDYIEASQRMTTAFNQVVARQDACAAIVWHGGGMRILFRDILKKGELGEIGDCSWVELERKTINASFIIKNKQRLFFN